MQIPILIFSLLLTLTEFLSYSLGGDCNNFPLAVKPEFKTNWGKHKQVILFLKNLKKQHICSAKLKITFPEGSRMLNKQNLKKSSNSSTPDEYVLPESWLLEDLEERRDSGFFMTGGSVLPKVEPVSIGFCDAREDVMVADCHGGFTVKVEQKHAWDDKKEVTLVFKNKSDKKICYGRFKVSLSKKSELLTSWNMRRLRTSGDYILPKWAVLEPNVEFRESGFILSGPLPTVRAIKYRYCQPA